MIARLDKVFINFLTPACHPCCNHGVTQEEVRSFTPVDAPLGGLGYCLTNCFTHGVIATVDGF